MYLRFVCARSVEGMRSREGFFQAAAALVHDPLTEGFVAEQIDHYRAWFSAHLERPDRFSRSGANGYDERDTKGLSWFKPTAHEHISKAFALKAVLDDNGYPIDVLKEKRLGYIVYEDDHQIVAEPFSDTLA